MPVIATPNKPERLTKGQVRTSLKTLEEKKESFPKFRRSFYEQICATNAVLIIYPYNILDKSIHSLFYLRPIQLTSLNFSVFCTMRNQIDVPRE